jgi:hypothetical protein
LFVFVLSSVSMVGLVPTQLAGGALALAVIKALYPGITSGLTRAT